MLPLKGPSPLRFVEVVCQFALVAVVLTVVFMPTLLIPFAHHDSWHALFMNDRGGCCIGHPLTSDGILVRGRPLGAFLENVASIPYTKVADLWIGRLWALLVMAAAFTCLFFVLHLMAMRTEVLRRRV